MLGRGWVPKPDPTGQGSAATTKPCSGRAANDIAKNGVLEPIVFLDGAILDGRNGPLMADASLRICEMMHSRSV